MKDELEDLAGHWLKALVNVEATKVRVGRWYDKKGKSQNLLVRIISLEIDFADRNKEFKIRQMVSNMRRAI